MCRRTSSYSPCDLGSFDAASRIYATEVEWNKGALNKAKQLINHGHMAQVGNIFLLYAFCNHGISVRGQRSESDFKQPHHGSLWYKVVDSEW